MSTLPPHWPQHGGWRSRGAGGGAALGGRDLLEVTQLEMQGRAGLDPGPLAQNSSLLRPSCALCTQPQSSALTPCRPGSLLALAPLQAEQQLYPLTCQLYVLEQVSPFLSFFLQRVV